MHISARLSGYLLRFTVNRRAPRRRGRNYRDMPPPFIEVDEPTGRSQRPPTWATLPTPPVPETTAPPFAEAWLAHSVSLALAAQGISRAPTPASLAMCLEQGGHLLALLAPRSAECRHDIDKLAADLFTVAACARDYRTLSDARQDLERLALQFARLFQSLLVSAAHGLADGPTAQSPIPN